MFIIILIQFFWFSISLTGWGVVCLQARLLPSKSIFSFLKQQGLITSWVILTAIGATVFVPVFLLCYILGLPVWSASLVYAAVLLLGLITLVINYRAILVYLRKSFKRTSRQQRIIGLIMLLVVLVPYCIQLLAGVDFNDDTTLHLAKLQFQLNTGHFTFADPYIGYNGVIDLRYMANTFGSLQVIVASVLHVMAYKVWFYSIAFHRLLFAASLFAVARNFLPRSTRSWSYAVLLMAPTYAVFVPYLFHYAELPHSVVVIWTALFFIGLKMLYEQKTSWLLILACVLIASSHALSSAYTMVFLMLVSMSIFCVKRRFTRREAVTTAACLMFLVVPVAINQLLPKGGTAPEVQANIGKGLHERALYTHNVGPFVVPSFNLGSYDYYLVIPAVDVKAIIVGVMLTGYALLFKQLKNRRLQHIFIWVLFLGVLETYNIYYISTLGYLYLIKHASSHKTRLILTLAVFFYVLIAYNPIILTLGYGHFPLWFFARFEDLNLLAFLAPIVGPLAVFRALAHYWSIPRVASGYSLCIAVLLIALLPYPRSPFRYTAIMQTDIKTYQDHVPDYQIMATLKQFEPYVRNKLIYTDDARVEYRMAIVTTGPHFGVLINPQSNQMQNIYQRAACNRVIAERMNIADLRAAHIQRVVVRTGAKAERGAEGIATLAASKPYLHLTATVGDERIYSVQTDGKANPTSKYCNIAYRE